MCYLIQPKVPSASQPPELGDIEAVFNSQRLPQHNTANQAAIKMLIDSFIRTTNRREVGGGLNRNRFLRLLINSDGN